MSPTTLVADAPPRANVPAATLGRQRGFFSGAHEIGLALIHAPQVIPFGFHAAFQPAA